MDDFDMKDSGKRTIFEGKAMREVIEGKGRYDLISPFAIKRLAIVMEKGAAKYDDRNWEKGGIKFGRYIDSLKRHISQYEMGMEDEDHLGQAMYNLMALLHFDELEDFTDDNLPKYLKKRTSKSNEEKTKEKTEENFDIEEIKLLGLNDSEMQNMTITKSGENITMKIIDPIETMEIIDAHQNLIDPIIPKKNKKEKAQGIEIKEEIKEESKEKIKEENEEEKIQGTENEDW